MILRLICFIVLFCFLLLPHGVYVTWKEIDSNLPWRKPIIEWLRSYVWYCISVMMLDFLLLFMKLIYEIIFLNMVYFINETKFSLSFSLYSFIRSQTIKVYVYKVINILGKLISDIYYLFMVFIDHVLTIVFVQSLKFKEDEGLFWVFVSKATQNFKLFCD